MIYEIVFVHLLNDFSGSPKILRETIRAVSKSGLRAKLYLGSSGDGFLSCSGITTTCYRYRRSASRLATLFSYALSQVILLFMLLFDRSIARNAVIYVNTLLPFGAALFGKFTGRKVIYHVHEVSLSPHMLNWVLIRLAHFASSMNVFVSDAHMKAMPIIDPPARRVHNALDDDFLQIALPSPYQHQHDGYFNILMVASLRDYKGIPELMDLAADLLDQKNIHFDLLVNDDQSAFDRYLCNRPVPPNVSLSTRTGRTVPFYRRASLVLNLSRVDCWVETFGLTILEAMAFGIPVIAPPVGGPSELVWDGVQGFLVDSRDRALLRDRVLQLSSDPPLCLRMSKAARERASEFPPGRFAEQITKVIDDVRRGAV